MSNDRVLIVIPEDWKCEQNVQHLSALCDAEGKDVSVLRCRKGRSMVNVAAYFCAAAGLPSSFWLIDARYTLTKFPPVPSKTTIFSTARTYKGSSFATHGGLYFIYDANDVLNFSDVEATQKASNVHPYDAFVLSHDEPDKVVQRSWDSFVDVFTDLTPVRSEKNIYHSHRALAERSTTSMFYVIDADFIRVGDLTPMFEEQLGDDANYVHVWNAANHINGLVYGHGGVKLFPQSVFDTGVQVGLDTTLGVSRFGIKIHGDVLGVHAFNWSPFSTWRTAVREAFKLQRSILTQVLRPEQYEDTAYRLEVWTTRADPRERYSELCIAGANYGKTAALTNHTVNIGWINDYRLLRQRFDAQFVYN